MKNRCGENDKRRIKMKAFMLIFAMALISQVQAIYFYLEKDQVKCFKDEVVKNYVSLFHPLILFFRPSR